MPFQSEAQRKKCWTMYNQAKKAGKEPKWDCEEWEKETKKKKLPKKKTSKKGSRGKKKSKK